MTYCIDFFRKFKKDGNFCGLDEKEAARITKYLDLIDQIVNRQKIPETQIMESLSVRAARPLLSATGDIRTEGLNYIVGRLKKGEKITTKDLQVKLGEFTEKNHPAVEHADKKVDMSTTPAGKKPESALSLKASPVQETTLPVGCIGDKCSYRDTREKVPTKCGMSGKLLSEQKTCPMDENERKAHLTTCEEIPPQPSLAAQMNGEKAPEPPVHRPPPCLGGGGCDQKPSRFIQDDHTARGPVCNAIGAPINQLPGNVCPYDIKLERMARQLPEERPGFHTASNRPSFQGIPKVSSDPGRTLTITFDAKQWEILKNLQRGGFADGFPEAVKFCVDEIGSRGSE